MRAKRYYRLTNGFTNRYRDQSVTGEVLVNMLNQYREVICPAICRYNFRLSRKQALLLCDSLGQGNWEKLWPTSEEKTMPTDEICRVFIWDIYYCSDRMSWDRLVRINWQYHRLLRRMEEENESTKYREHVAVEPGCI